MTNNLALPPNQAPDLPRRAGRAARLANALLADRAGRDTATSRHNIVACFTCGFTFVYKGHTGDLNGRFCSMRCQDWYDAGNPPIGSQIAAINAAPLEAWKVVAGPPGVEIGSSYYDEFLAAARSGSRVKRRRSTKPARKPRRPATYSVRINGHGYWQPGAALRRLGFQLVDCGFDGPEARAQAERLNAEADLRANHAQKGQ